MSENESPYKIYLSENEVPTAWYNVRADGRKIRPVAQPCYSRTVHI